MNKDETEERKKERGGGKKEKIETDSFPPPKKKRKKENPQKRLTLPPHEKALSHKVYSLFTHTQSCTETFCVFVSALPGLLHEDQKELKAP